MEPVLRKGLLTTWKDDRGFGFIKPEDGSKEVFLHITALQGASRRPKVGDTIFYEQVTEANGKVRAARASIQGIPSQSLSRSPSRASPTRKPKKLGLIEIFAGIGVIATIALLVMAFNRSRVLVGFDRSRSASPVTPTSDPSVSPTAPIPEASASPAKPIAKSSTSAVKPLPERAASPATPIAQPAVSQVAPIAEPAPPPVTPSAEPECTIKGNISIETGDKLYHLPGMEDYEATNINLNKGERWFCTEAEAISNGWRKAPR